MRYSSLSLSLHVELISSTMTSGSDQLQRAPQSDHYRLCGSHRVSNFFLSSFQFSSHFLASHQNIMITHLKNKKKNSRDQPWRALESRHFHSFYCTKALSNAYDNDCFCVLRRCGEIILSFHT